MLQPHLVSFPRKSEILVESKILVENLNFFHTPPAHNAHVKIDLLEFCYNILYGQTKKWWGYQKLKISMRICLLILMKYTNVTDGRPLHHDTGHAIYAQCQAAKILTKF